MEEALYDVPLYREFAGLDSVMTRFPDETTILRFRHRLEVYGIAAQGGFGCRRHVDCAASLTQKGGNWYFDMKVHVGVDAESGLIHTVIGTATNMYDINVAHALLHGEQRNVCRRRIPGHRKA
ncbi:Mobile element protein [Candidatus Paraburkholderia calva]|nr:Mobile element protein [Candidatus Paraburkholderia calva]